MKTVNHRRCQILPLLAALVLVGSGAPAAAEASECEAVTHIEGEYRCGGECIMTEPGGKRKVVEVSGETDRIERYPKTREPFYQVHITGAQGFRELEIGVFDGHVLWTATAEVSDGQYPVLEDFHFEAGRDCRAQGYHKIVRNPSPAIFKSCLVRCKKAKR